MTHDRIVSTPGICGGEPRIQGTRMTTAILASYRRRGESDEEILKSFDYLTQADLDAAWEFLGLDTNTKEENSGK